MKLIKPNYLILLLVITQLSFIKNYDMEYESRFYDANCIENLKDLIYQVGHLPTKAAKKLSGQLRHISRGKYKSITDLSSFLKENSSQSNLNCNEFNEYAKLIGNYLGGSSIKQPLDIRGNQALIDQQAKIIRHKLTEKESIDQVDKISTEYQQLEKRLGSGDYNSEKEKAHLLNMRNKSIKVLTSLVLSRKNRIAKIFKEKLYKVVTFLKHFDKKLLRGKTSQRDFDPIKRKINKANSYTAILKLSQPNDQWLIEIESQFKAIRKRLYNHLNIVKINNNLTKHKIKKVAKLEKTVNKDKLELHKLKENQKSLSNKLKETNSKINRIQDNRISKLLELENKLINKLGVRSLDEAGETQVAQEKSNESTKLNKIKEKKESEISALKAKLNSMIDLNKQLKDKVSKTEPNIKADNTNNNSTVGLPNQAEADPNSDLPPEIQAFLKQLEQVLTKLFNELKIKPDNQHEYREVVKRENSKLVSLNKIELEAQVRKIFENVSKRIEGKPIIPKFRFRNKGKSHKNHRLRNIQLE